MDRRVAMSPIVPIAMIATLRSILLPPKYANDVDDDCNGLIDDGLPFVTYYADTDGDGYGDELVTVSTCDGPPFGIREQ